MAAVEFLTSCQCSFRGGFVSAPLVQQAEFVVQRRVCRPQLHGDLVFDARILQLTVASERSTGLQMAVNAGGKDFCHITQNSGRIDRAVLQDEKTAKIGGRLLSANAGHPPCNRAWQEACNASTNARTPTGGAALKHDL